MCVVDSSRLPPPKKDFCLVISAWYPMSRNTVSERYIFSVIQDTQKVFLLVAVDVKVREIGISYRHNALTKCHCKSRPHFLTHFNGEVDFSPLCEQRTIWKHLTSNVLGNFWHTNNWKVLYIYAKFKKEKVTDNGNWIRCILTSISQCVVRTPLVPLVLFWW